MSVAACPESASYRAYAEEALPEAYAVHHADPTEHASSMRHFSGGAGSFGGGPMREVLGLAGPATAHLLLVTTVFMADRALVGRFAAAELASLQISSTLSWSLCSIAAALGVGAGAQVARAVGAGTPAQARSGTRLALLAALLFGLLTLLLGWPLSGHVVGWASPATGQIEAAALGYLQVLLLAMPLAFAEAVAVACLHAAGDTRTPLYAAVVANALNLALSAALVLGWAGLPALGAVGAAIGTAVALAVQAVWLCAKLWRCPKLAVGRREMPSWRGQLRLDLHAAGGLWRVVWPAAGEKALYHAGYLAYAAAVTTLGAAAMAANQSLISIEALGFTVAEGCGVAAATLAGQRLGAGKPREALRAVLTASALAAGLLTLVGGAMAAMPNAAIGLFCADPKVISSGRDALTIAAWAQPFMASATVMSMGLRGAGRTRTALLTTLCCSVVLRLALTGLLVLHSDLGLAGIWIASGVDWLLHAAVLAWVWLRLPSQLASGRIIVDKPECAAVCSPLS